MIDEELNNNSNEVEWVNHSGGCPGADMYWENVGKRYGVFSIAYSFPNHTQYGENQLILNSDELQEGWVNVKKASIGIKRPLYVIENNPYVRNLLCRNWFQVRNSDGVYAIATFIKNSKRRVNGGTGWAVQMAIDNQKEIYFFEQIENKWFTYDYSINLFTELDHIPTLTKHFAGIGSRDLMNSGKRAIEAVYEITFLNSHYIL
jgi:hypothetical protein